MDINHELSLHYKNYGDRLKFKELESDSYDIIRGALTKYAYGKLRNWMDAEDAVQDAYIHILTYPPIGDGHNISGLYKITLDRSIANIKAKNFHREQILQEEVVTDEENQMITDSTESTDLQPDQTFDLINQTNLIMDMSDNLKPKQKAIVRLAMIFGYSYQEIADITKTNPKTIDNTLTYFRQRIREHPKYENLCR